MKNTVQKLIPPASIKSRNIISSTTNEDPATLLKSYMDLVESADKKLDKQQTDLYRNKVRALCSSYRIVSSPKKANDQLPHTKKQFELPLCQEKIDKWLLVIKESLKQQEEALNKRIQMKKTNSHTSLELNKKPKKLLLQVKTENTIQSLEETIKKLNEDKAKCIAELVERLAREKYTEIGKVEERYANEIANCKIPSNLYKAIINKINEKKALEIKGINEKYAMNQTNGINQAQTEYAQKLTNLYNEMKAMPKSRSPRNAFTQTQRKRVRPFDFPAPRLSNQEIKNS